MSEFEVRVGQVETLPAFGTLPETHHVFEEDSIEAVKSSLAADRPLLVRGEPGMGKSQLARAVAQKLGRVYLSFAVDARTEPRDLLYSVDTVARLAAAQVAGHLSPKERSNIKTTLSEKQFTNPGPLWWVFNWKSAATQAKLGEGFVPKVPQGWKEQQGAVVLIDEIDKADSSVPNGLLEALGQREFLAPGGEIIATDPGKRSPVIIITTNEERVLPDAFVRRCLVLNLAWSKDPGTMKQELMARGAAHFPNLDESILGKAAEMVVAQREFAEEHNVCPPGGAEYLDLLRVVSVRWKGDMTQQQKALEKVSKFVLEKHPTEPR